MLFIFHQVMLKKSVGNVSSKMKATPTVTLYSASTSDAAGKWAAYKGGWDYCGIIFWSTDLV